MTKAEWTWFLVKRNKTAYFMIAPFMILFFIFTIIPVALSLVLSFTSFNMLEWPKFIFMDNYITLFLDDDLFVTALKNTFIFTFGSLVFQFTIGYLLALFFYKRFTLAGEIVGFKCEQSGSPHNMNSKNI